MTGEAGSRSGGREESPGRDESRDVAAGRGDRELSIEEAIGLGRLEGIEMPPIPCTPKASRESS